MKRLTLALVLTSAVAALEFWGGLRSGSLALLTDAVHVCTDVLALGLALAVLIGAKRPANRRKTFGYGRLEVLGALVNGAVLLALTIVIVYEAFHRFFAPHVPEGGLMWRIATIGLLVNLGVSSLLMRDHEHNLNMRAALYHVLGDALGALSVIVGGVLILATHLAWIDPLLSLFVATIIVIGVASVLREATDVLLEAVPRGIDTEEVRLRLGGLSGVVQVHDLHLWTIGTAARALSAHVLLDDRRISEATVVLREIEDVARDRYGVTHTTIQFECESCGPDECVVFTQPTQPVEVLEHRD